MEDYRLDQSGQEVQDILNGAAMQVDLTAETERATEAEQTLQGNIDAEETRAHGAEDTLQDNIDAEESRAKAAEKQNADDIDAIEEKIPSGASSSNKLATEEYVADAVATATATFRGTYNLVSDLHLTVNATEQQIAAALAGAISTADNNDYCFILVPTSSETPTEIKEIDRYKFNGTAWGFEYKLNNSGFTAAQWAAINSGITSGDVAKLAALPTNAQLTTLLAGLQSDIDGEEARAKGAEGTLQDNIDAEETRAKAAEKQNADDIDAIEAVLPENASSENKVATESEIDSLSAAIEAILLLIPSAATSLNKLADKAFVNSSIATATATFRGTYNLVDDLGLTTSATHAQIATALAGAILTADNNDYAFVQIPTSDAMPTEIAKTERYKFNGTAWEYEYDLNNSGFTADQWAAINSGITQALVTKLSALPTNAELTTELGTLTSGINTINQKIPNAASQANKLVDTAAMESYIVQVLDVLTASFNVTSTDGHVTVQISQVDGKITSVAVSTSDIASAADLNLKASQADLTALASRVTTAEGNITTLGGRITTAEGNITSLGGRMTTAEGNITSLGGRVSTNETDIANLQQLYNDLQQSKPVPVTALPSTGQQQGVIYRLAGTTSYSDYMWNGSSWVLMATYNNAIDPRPKKASQNLVTSGGVFDNMGALDVSELNATENPHTLAKYVDMSAALAAIPTDYQKGGMSIKFVQSSDNKYVQFRLMAQNFTTDITQWQGVDVEPKNKSHNLVESGGVAKYTQKIDYTIIAEIETSSTAKWGFQNVLDDMGRLLVRIISDKPILSAILYNFADNVEIEDLTDGEYHDVTIPDNKATRVFLKTDGDATTQLEILSYSILLEKIDAIQSAIAAAKYTDVFNATAGWKFNDVLNKAGLCAVRIESEGTIESASIYSASAGGTIADIKDKKWHIVNIPQVTDTRIFAKASENNTEVTLSVIKNNALIGVIKDNIPEVPKIFHIGTGQDYTTLKEGISSAMAYSNSTVYVHPGVYDLMNEFASEIAAYSGSSTGISIGNDIHIIFMAGAYVKANYTSQGNETQDTWVKTNFNPIKCQSSNFIIENLDIEASNTRYCVHDEAAGSNTYIHKYINCRMKYVNSLEGNQFNMAIGGGLGEHAYIFIQGGRYEAYPNGAEYGAISYHNGSNVNADSTIVIEDIYIADDNCIRFIAHGPSPIASKAMVCGCSLGSAIKNDQGDGESATLFSLTEWNNIIRS